MPFLATGPRVIWRPLGAALALMLSAGARRAAVVMFGPLGAAALVSRVSFWPGRRVSPVSLFQRLMSATARLNLREIAISVSPRATVWLVRTVFSSASTAARSMFEGCNWACAVSSGRCTSRVWPAPTRERPEIPLMLFNAVTSMPKRAAMRSRVSPALSR